MDPAEQEARKGAVDAALADVGVPYRWGGNDPALDGGLDCSGAVIRWLRGAGIYLHDQTAHDLYSKLEPVAMPRAGDLAFYGSSAHATHVVMVVVDGGVEVVGANRGGRPGPAESPEAYAARMVRAGARVRRVGPDAGGSAYRSDLVGYRRPPYPKGTS